MIWKFNDICKHFNLHEHEIMIYTLANLCEYVLTNSLLSITYCVLMIH